MKDRISLRKDAMRIALMVEKEINTTIPESVSDMPYARQYVLEVVADILKKAV